MTDAEKAIAKVEHFHRFLGSKAKDQKARDMHDALGFVIMLAKAHLRNEEPLSEKELEAARQEMRDAGFGDPTADELESYLKQKKLL